MKQPQALKDYQVGMKQAKYDLYQYGKDYCYDQLKYGLIGRNYNYTKGYRDRVVK